MPFIVLVLGAVGAAIWWWVRSNPSDAVHVARDVVTTVRNAPRKLAFRKQLEAHPVEGIDDPNIAICAIAQAFIELDSLPTSDQRAQLHLTLRRKLGTDEDITTEMQVLGRWLLTQCQGPKPAIPRLGRRLYKLEAARSWNLLQDILSELVGDDLSEDQKDALSDLKLALHK